MIELGKTYRDKITQFTGVCVAKSTWLTGCTTSGLTPPLGQDGKIVDTAWFDDGRLIEVSAERVIIGPAMDTTSGGPCESIPAPNR